MLIAGGAAKNNTRVWISWRTSPILKRKTLCSGT